MDKLYIVDFPTDSFIKSPNAITIKYTYIYVYIFTYFPHIKNE